MTLELWREFLELLVQRFPNVLAVDFDKNRMVQKTVGAADTSSD